MQKVLQEFFWSSIPHKKYQNTSGCGTVGSIMNITNNQYKKGTQSTQLTQSTCHTCINNSIYFFFFLSCREKSHDSNKSSREISKSHSQNLVLFNKI